MLSNCKVGPSPYNFPAAKPPSYDSLPVAVIMNGNGGHLDGNFNKHFRSHQPIPPKLSPIHENVESVHHQVNTICAPVHYISSLSPPVQWMAQTYGPSPVFYPQGHPGMAPLSGNSPICAGNPNYTNPGHEPYTQPPQFNIPPLYQPAQPTNTAPEYPTGAFVPQYNTVAPSGEMTPEFYKPTSAVFQPYPQQFQFNQYPQTMHGQQYQFNPVLNHCNVQFNTQGHHGNPKPNVSSYEYDGTVYYYYNTPLSKNGQNSAQEGTEQNVNAGQKPDNKRDTTAVILASVRQQKPKRHWKRKYKN